MMPKKSIDLLASFKEKMGKKSESKKVEEQKSAA